jgi:hypothetical protein
MLFMASTNLALTHRAECASICKPKERFSGSIPKIKLSNSNIFSFLAELKVRAALVRAETYVRAEGNQSRVLLFC